MPPTVEITAPSRLHFGLFALGGSESRQYGGAGAMISAPVLRMRLTAADRFIVRGRYAARVTHFATQFAEWAGLEKPPACQLEVLAAPDEHTGLGLGTQLGLSLAAGLVAITGGEQPTVQQPTAQQPTAQQPTVQQLATSVGRGNRSAVGAYGFQRGGLIVDDGKLAGEPLGRLACRVDLPTTWRFVLVRPPASSGLSGTAEADAFAQLTSPPASTTARLRQLAIDELVPAAETSDMDRFAAAVHEFNVLAGECFAAVQHGPFASAAIRAVVEQLQLLGCVGCGQSSWGPTVFGLARSQTDAEQLAKELASTVGQPVTIAQPDNRGAKIEIS